MSLKPNVAIYCRLSREDEDSSQSLSIQNQKEFLTDYANKNNWNIYDYYIDDGYTGTNFNRPGFKRMINDIENKLINIVITKDLSRLGRNYLDTGRYTEEYFPLHNIRYIAVNDNFDSNNSDNEFAPFKNIINEWYAKDISRKVKSTFKLKTEKGILFKSSYPLYGYKYDDTGNRIIDEQVVDNVRLVFDLHIKGYNANQIAKKLTEMKVYTPKNYFSKLYNSSITSFCQSLQLVIPPPKKQVTVLPPTYCCLLYGFITNICTSLILILNLNITDAQANSILTYLNKIKDNLLITI